MIWCDLPRGPVYLFVFPFFCLPSNSIGMSSSSESASTRKRLCRPDGLPTSGGALPALFFCTLSPFKSMRTSAKRRSCVHRTTTTFDMADTHASARRCSGMQGPRLENKQREREERSERLRRGMDERTWTAEHKRSGSRRGVGRSASPAKTPAHTRQNVTRQDWRRNKELACWLACLPACGV